MANKQKSASKTKDLLKQLHRQHSCPTNYPDMNNVATLRRDLAATKSEKKIANRPFSYSGY